jgi:hypothetical protein
MEACYRICVLVGWPRRIEGGNFGTTRELPRRHEDRWRRSLISVYFIGIFFILSSDGYRCCSFLLLQQWRRSTYQVPELTECDF